MATLALAVAGAAAGSTAGAGIIAFGMTGAQLGWAAGMMAGQMLFSDQHSTYGARLSDLQVSAGAIAAHIPVVHGGARVLGGVIWSTPIIEASSSSGSGKGGGGSHTTYSYSASFALFVCKGPIKAITRIWADGKKIWDVSLGSTTKEREDAKKAGIEIYTGTETQTPNSTIESDKGVGKTPAFLGLVYVVFTDHSLTPYGNRRPNLEFEVIESAPDLAINTTSELEPAAADGIRSLQARSGTNLLVLVKKSAIGGGGENFTPQKIDVITGKLVSSDETLLQTYRGSDHELIGAVLYSETYEWWLQSGLDGVSIRNPKGGVADFSRTNQGGFWGSPMCVIFCTGDPSTYVTGWKDLSSNHITITSHNITGNYTSHIRLDMGSNNKISIIFNKIDTLYITNSTDTLKRVSFPDLLPLPDVAVPDITGHTDHHAPALDAYRDKLVVHRVVNTEIIPELYEVEADGTYATLVSGNPVQEASSTLSLSCEYSITERTVFEEYVGPGAASKPTADVISDICTASGLLQTDYDVSGVDGEVGGLVEDSNVTARSVLSPLMDVKHLMAVESGGIINFSSIKKESLLSVVTIKEGDLGAGINRASESPVITAISSVFGAPEAIQIEYKVAGGDYKKESVRQKITSRTVPARSEKKFSSTVIFSDRDEPAIAAERLLVSEWIERVIYSFNLPYKYVRLDPGDVVHLPVLGTNIHVRIRSIKYTTGEVIYLTGVEDRESLFESIKTGIADTAPIEDDKEKLSISMALLDIPALSDLDAETFGFYVSAWTGGQHHVNSILYRSADDGGTWFDIAPVLSNGSSGITTQSCDANLSSTWDMENEITVQMFAGELNSASDINTLSGANIGIAGSELFQWKKAELISAGTYKLSQLIRGARGTKSVAHAAGERFVVLSSQLITLIGSDIGIKDTPIDYKIVREGEPIQEVIESDELTISNGRLKPYPGCLAHTHRIADDQEIAWSPRSRFTGIMSVDDGMGEPDGHYLIEVWLDNTLLRTIRIDAPLGIYTTAMRAHDGAQLTDILIYRIFHVSALAGRGDYIEVSE